MRLDAQIGRHSGQNHPSDAPLPELEGEVVILRSEDFVWAHDDRISVLDIGLIHVEPIGPEPSKPSRSRGPARSNIPMLCMTVSSAPSNFHP